MRQFVYILIISLAFGCAKNTSKEASTKASDALDFAEEEPMMSKKDAYIILITEKLQEALDKRRLAEKHPDFNIEMDQDWMFSYIKEVKIKEIGFIESFTNISDSLKTVKTKVIFDSKTDTILTYIKTSETNIDGEKLKTIKISFDTLKKTKTISTKQSDANKPIHVERFSIRDLNFTWEEINACDCLFMVKANNTPYQKLYFGRFIGDTTGIIQLGKNTEKQIVTLSKPRSKNRKPGSFWKEVYQNNLYKIELKATPTQPKVKTKHTYFIDFTFIELSTKKVIKNLILTNCKS